MPPIHRKRVVAAAAALAAFALPAVATIVAGPKSGAETGNGYVQANGDGGDRPPPKK